MRLFTVVSNPRDVTWRQFRIEKTKQSRWTTKHGSVKDTFHTHDPFAIQLQLQIARHTRPGAIRADQVARRYRARRRTGAESKCQFAVGRRMAEVTCLRKPMSSGQ